VLWRPPHKLLGIALVLFLVVAVLDPNPMAWLFGVFVSLVGFLRWQTWRAERIILTSKRIIRVQGVPETTTSETSLRVDRISGARLIQTVPGKILGYGTIELEAPGDHPDIRKLEKIVEPKVFYMQLRRLIFGEYVELDPDDGARHTTAPLPTLPPDRQRFGRRRG
jgi:hypothetical protein